MAYEQYAPIMNAWGEGSRSFIEGRRPFNLDHTLALNWYYVIHGTSPETCPSTPAVTTNALGVGPLSYFIDDLSNWWYWFPWDTGGWYDFTRAEGMWQTELRTNQYGEIFNANVAPHGTITYYYPSGELLARVKFANGCIIDDVVITYYPDGSLRERVPVVKPSYYYLNFDEQGSGWSGTHYAYHPGGILGWEVNYRNGYVHGTARYYDDEPPHNLIEEETFFDGDRRGPASYWWSNGNLKEQGQYMQDPANTNSYLGEACGDWSYWDEDGTFLLTINYGTCSTVEVAIIDPPYPDLDPDAPQEMREIRGYVFDADTSEPIEGVEMSFGADFSSTDNRGFYRMIVTGAETGTLFAASTNYFTQQRLVDFGSFSFMTETFRLTPDYSGTEPAIIDVTSRYGDIFLHGYSVTNVYTAYVYWKETTPSSVVFEVNGYPYEEPAFSPAVETAFDMGYDFIPGERPDANEMILTAYSTNGLYSLPYELHPIVVPLPDWASIFGIFSPSRTTDVYKYSAAVAYPAEPFGFQFTPPSIIPYVGGRTIGMTNTQFQLKAEIKTDGTGAAAVEGTSGMQIGPILFAGTVGGEGGIAYDKQYLKGYLWSGAKLKLGIAGGISFEENLIRVIPPMAALTNKPFIGSAVSYLGNMVKAKAELKTGFEFQPEIVDNLGTLDWAKSEFELKTEVGLGASAGDVNRFGVEVSGGGAVKSVLQYPPVNNEYLKEWAVELVFKMNLAVMSFAFPLEASHLVGGSGGGGSGGFSIGDPIPLGMGCVDLPGYHRFVGRTPSAKSPSKIGDLFELTLVADSYPYSDPTLDAISSSVAVAYVYLDPTNQPHQGTDIHVMLSEDGGYNFEPPIEITDNTQGDFNPQISFDGNGNLLAAWEQVADSAFPTNGLVEDMAAGLEIVYAFSAGSTGSWSAAIALTTNAWLDFQPRLVRSSGGTVVLVWQSNPGNEAIGHAAAPSRFHASIWNAGSRSFGAVIDFPGGFTNVLDWDFAHDGSSFTLAWTEDPDGSPETLDDLEVYTLTFNGSWGSRLPLTANSVPDRGVKAIYPSAGDLKLVWLNGSNMVYRTNEITGAFSVLKEGLTDIALDAFSLSAVSEGDIAVTWQDHRDGSADLFYKTYDGFTETWGSDRRLMSSTNEEWNFKTVFSQYPIMAGVFNAFDPLFSNQTADIVFFSRVFSADPSIPQGGVTIAPSDPLPGQLVTLAAEVHNLGEWAVPDAVAQNLQVRFFHGDPDFSGSVIGTASAMHFSTNTLPGGTSCYATINWTIPSDILDTGPWAVYAVVDPDELQIDESLNNNTGSVLFVRPDLIMEELLFKDNHNGSAQFIATLGNAGPPVATNIRVDLQLEGGSVANYVVPTLAPGKKAQILFHIEEGFVPDYGMLASAVADPYDFIDETSESNNVIHGSAPVARDGSYWDTDGDLMADDWELEHFGSLARDGTGDADGDGNDDRTEYYAGKVPTNSLSFFAGGRLQASTNAMVRFNWDTETGTVYSVEHITDLFTGHWERVSIVPATGSTYHMEHSPSNSPGYYRVTIDPDFN